MRQISIAILLILISLIGCEEKKDKELFLSTEVQDAIQRNIIKNALTLELERDLQELEIFDYYQIKEIKEQFVLHQPKVLEVNYLNKDSLKIEKSLTITSGRGPKELEYIMAFDANEQIFAVADNRLFKVILFDHDGDMIREFLTEKKTPHRLSLSNNKSLTMLYETSFEGFGQGFLENIDLFGEMNYALNKEAFEDLHPFATEGNIQSINDTLYYVGGYEPFIKKYVNGSLIYSRATIDNYDTSLNYVTIISDESRSTSLTPEAVFSSLDFDIKDGYMFIIPDPNGDREFSYIDVYNTSNGKYIKSFKPLNFPHAINVYENERFILTIENSDETNQPVFRKYSY